MSTTQDLQGQGGRASFITGDVFDVLATIEDGSVDLVLTSPPFLALRSYLPADHPDKHREIGAEPDPASFLATLLALTAEWRRVLAPHGSICVELGDTYSGSGGAGGDYNAEGLRDGQQKFDGSNHRRGKIVDHDSGRRNPGAGWPLPKSLCGIPHLYHLSLAYGRNLLTGEPCEPWRVRNVVAWCRPNPPVGALGDKFRPATSYMTIACPSGQRYFDLDAVRTAPKDYGPRYGEHKVEGIGGRTDQVANPLGPDGQRIQSNPAGAPPLDWWEIPTTPYVTPEGVIVVPSGETVRRVRVPLGADADGIQRTVSPDCPLHGSPDHQDSSAEHDGPGASTRTDRTGRTGDHLAQGQLLDSLPTPASTAPDRSSDSPAGPAATAHSKADRRTGPAPETRSPDTPSSGMSGRTDGTPGQPSSSEQRPDTPESRTSEVGSPGSPEHRMVGGTAGTDSAPHSSSACSCSHWVEVSVASESTSDYADNPPDYWNIPTQAYSGAHYAAFPPALLERPIKSMVPARVCNVCGEPSRRIVEKSPVGVSKRGLQTSRQLGGGRADGSAGWESVATSTLGWTDCGHGSYACSTCNGDVPALPGDLPGQLGAYVCPCGGRDIEYVADHWRPGVVLDPFGGSGTTLAVATGRGHHAIGIDLDPRNVDLARDRVGPMFLDEFTLDQWKNRSEVPS